MCVVVDNDGDNNESLKYTGEYGGGGEWANELDPMINTIWDYTMTKHFCWL